MLSSNKYIKFNRFKRGRIGLLEILTLFLVGLTGWILFVSIFSIHNYSVIETIIAKGDELHVRYGHQVKDNTFDFQQKIDTKLFAGIAAENCSTNNDYCVQWGTVGRFRIDFAGQNCTDYHFWTKLKAPLLVTFDLKGIDLFGGSEIGNQRYPIQVDDDKVDSLVSKQLNSEAILEPLWLTSTGFSLTVNQKAPLFVKYTRSELTLNATRAPPYIRGDTTYLDYRICKYDDVKTAYQRAIADAAAKPSAAPDYRMVEVPVWSTWAKYKKDINETATLQFANLIVKHGLPNSQLEIDDMWETCYGSLTVDRRRFPDMKRLVGELHAMGFRVTIWVHPFVNSDCQPYFDQGVANNYFVKNVDGSVATSWWNGIGAYIDVTNPLATKWFESRLRTLLQETGIDSFKFDAGESGWTPQVPVFHDMKEDHPETILKAYVEMAATFGPMVEVRSARQTHQYPIFVRMMDRNTKWSGELGLNTLIPELLHMNTIGYPFVLPDMIGGNGYDKDTLTKELYVRWLQANVFMPSIQLSYPPWDFDDEVVNITRKYLELHKKYAPLIYQLMQRATVEPTMVNAPIWWIDPKDQTALKTDSEFLLGDVLVAPVLEQGATSRDIYFPKGTWQDETIKDAPPIIGPTWVRGYPASLKVLPYFTRKTPSSSSSTLSPSVFVILVVSLFFLYT